MANPLTATVAPDGQVHIRKGAWSRTMHRDNLADFLRLYRYLRDRKEGKYADRYADDVAALEAAQRQAEQQ